MSVMLLALAGTVSVVRRGGVVRAEDARPEGGANAACAGCHREIYERYRQTPMANASGPARDGLIPADIVDRASGVHYEVGERDGQVWLSYERDGAARALKGSQRLEYFLGSGKRGRTYLFEQEGYWFEAPINWYAKKQVWEMTPNHEADREMPLTLPVDSGCLHCHASRVAQALPDARNHFAGAPFKAGGITCESCHGDGGAHVASGGKTHMMDIDRLAAARRDSVCLSCHLEGQAAVIREGRRIEAFRPGDDLAEYALFFVYRSETGSGGRATSQWEALLKSECKRQSGDRLTCTTCHDPHGSPSAAERVEFYRQKCLQCHGGAGFEKTHHGEERDCTACHMARPPANDIAHEQVTDHWIKKQVSAVRQPLVTTGALETVGGGTASDRDLGLAYAQMAARGDRTAGERAMELLRKAEKEGGGDHEVHAQLGFLEQVSGDKDGAAAEYRLALRGDEFDALAGGNLALIEAQEHHYAAAVALWKTVFAHHPTELGAGMNLAVVECGLGDGRSALETLDRLLKFAPDHTGARGMEAAIRTGARKCEVR
jgi:predicted CXXCH cytochrome family protein